MELSNLGKSKGGYAPVPDSESNKILSTDDKSKSNYNYIKIATITFILSSFLAVLVYYGDKMNHNITPDVVILQTSYTYGDKMTNLDTNLLNSRGFNIDKLSFNNKIDSEVQTSILHENIVTLWGHGLGTIKINDKIKYQKILGFGGAFTEAAAYNFDKLPKLKQDEVINLYFGEDSIGYTLGRIHINSCDFSLKSYTFDECDGDYDLMCFDTEVTHDNAIMIPFMIKAGIAVADKSNNEDKLRLLSSPWSPPSWMKKPDKNTGNQSMLGSAEPTCLLDDPKVHLAWANYISKFIDAYKKKGVSIWALTPQNEPEFAAPWEACSYNASAELDFINNYLGPTIRQNHPEVLLLAFDHNKDHLFHWAKTMVDGTKKDKTGKDYVDGMAFHWYAGENDRMLDGTYGYDALNLTHHYAKDKILLATEGCSCPGVNINDWLRAERLSHDIIFDLLNYAQGWIDWNLLVDSNGGPNHVDNMCDAPIVLSSDYSTFHIQPKFYYMGHISKYIVPDSVRIDSSIVGNYNFIDTDPNIRSGVEVGVFNCEKSVRQRWFVNPNSSIELTRYVLDDIQDEQGSYSRLCLGVGSVDRPFIRLVNCNNIDKDNHRIVQVKQTDEGQLVDKVSKKCLALVNGITDPGVLIELQTCDSTVSHQRFVIDKVTGEIIPYSTLDGSNHVGLCLTAGWPMLHGVAVQNPSNQIVTVIVNEAMVDTELILFANMKELNFGINGRSIQTVIF